MFFSEYCAVSVHPVTHNTCFRHIMVISKNMWMEVFVPSSFVHNQCHGALNQIIWQRTEATVEPLLYCFMYGWLACCVAFQIPIGSTRCCVACGVVQLVHQSLSRSQSQNREKRLLCDWISFWAPCCLINENDPGAESEAIVCTVTKSLPINSILNRISQSTPGVRNLLA